MLEKIKATDESLIRWVSKLHTPILNKIMLFMTFLGDAGKVWFLVIAVIMYFKRSFYIGASLFFGLVFGFITAEVVVKRIVARTRPYHKLDEKSLILKKLPKFYSFPSSHSCTSFAMVTVSFMLCGTWTTLALFVIALGISCSRFYLQAHYLTDVICGIIFGIICGVAAAKLVYLVFTSINPALLKSI